MALSTFLAKFFGFYFLILCGAFVLNPLRLKAVQKNLAENPAMVTMIGIIVTIFGLLLVLNHYAFYPDWRSLITLICWIILFKGCAILLFPDKTINFAKHIASKKSHSYIIAGIYLVFSLVLLCCGFCTW